MGLQGVLEQLAVFVLIMARQELVDETQYSPMAQLVLHSGPKAVNPAMHSGKSPHWFQLLPVQRLLGQWAWHVPEQVPFGAAETTRYFPREQEVQLLGVLKAVQVLQPAAQWTVFGISTILMCVPHRISAT